MKIPAITVVSMVLLFSLLSGCSAENTGTLSIYTGANPSQHHGYFSNWMPPEAADMIKLELGDHTYSAPGKADIKVVVNFAPPYWCGIAVASTPNYWGETPSDTAFDLRGMKRLVFRARGERGGECLQVKVAIAGDKPYGDSASTPAETGWLQLTPDWQTYELPVERLNLTRVITPFCFVTDREHNSADQISFYLDDIRFEAGDADDASAVTVEVPQDSQFSPGKSPADLYEKFRQFGKDQQWHKQYDLFDPRSRADIDGQLRAALALTKQGGLQSQTMSGPQLLGLLFEAGNVNWDRPIVLRQTADGDKAHLYLLDAGDNGADIVILKLHRIGDEWYFQTALGLQDSLDRPMLPDVSAVSVYNAFLVYRNRGDLEAVCSLIDQATLADMANGLRQAMTSQVADPQMLSRINAADDRTLIITALKSGKLNPIKVISWKETRGQAYIQIEIDSPQGPAQRVVPLTWSDGLWRIGSL